MINIQDFRAGTNLMIDKIISNYTNFANQKLWLSKASSRENIDIFLRGDILREWSIARSIERARIETPSGDDLRTKKYRASPPQLSGRG